MEAAVDPLREAESGQIAGKLYVDSYGFVRNHALTLARSQARRPGDGWRLRKMGQVGRVHIPIAPRAPPRYPARHEARHLERQFNSCSARSARRLAGERAAGCALPA